MTAPPLAVGAGLWPWRRYAAVARCSDLSWRLHPLCKLPSLPAFRLLEEFRNLGTDDNGVALGSTGDPPRLHERIRCYRPTTRRSGMTRTPKGRALGKARR